MSNTGAELIPVVKTIIDGEFSGLWQKLPMDFAGAYWKNEVISCAERMLDYLDIDGGYHEDYLRELADEFANNECEDYYLNIHNRVHNLSLWAIPEIDYVIRDMILDEDSLTLIILESRYLYGAMTILWNAVADYVMEKVGA